jgi:hypothetical protein
MVCCSPDLIASGLTILQFLGIPIMLRVIYRDQFVRGPFHLGPFSYPVAVTAVIWILFISIAFLLPQVNVGIPLTCYDYGLRCLYLACQLANVKLRHRRCGNSYIL